MSFVLAVVVIGSVPAGCGSTADNETVQSDELQRFIAENPNLVDEEMAVLDE